VTSSIHGTIGILHFGDNFVSLPVERSIAGRVGAKADSMNVHYHQSHLHQRDFHSARSADAFRTGGIFNDTHARGSVATHSVLLLS
jgi:hypothetical protein